MKKLFCLNPSFRCSSFDVIGFVTLLDQLQNWVLCENLLSQIFSSRFRQGQDRSLELIAKENKTRVYLWKVEILGERKNPRGTLELKNK